LLFFFLGTDGNDLLFSLSCRNYRSLHITAPQWEVQFANCEAAKDAVFEMNDECFYERRAA
jgi:hypothetical protein